MHTQQTEDGNGAASANKAPLRGVDTFLAGNIGKYGVGAQHSAFFMADQERVISCPMATDGKAIVYEVVSRVL